MSAILDPLGRIGTLETSSSCSSLNEFEQPLAPLKDSARARTPFIIGVAGGASSGKNQVCRIIMDRLREVDSSVGMKVVTIRLENFYRELSAEEQKLAETGEYNFDHPNAIDFRLLEDCMEDILHGRAAGIPQYDFQKNVRLPETVRIEKPDVVIFSGIFMLYKRRVRDALNLKVFVDVDSDVRLARQVVRDTEERYKKSLEKILQYYITFVKPAFEDFILPSKKFADVIIPRGHQNTVAIDLLTQHIIDILSERGSDRVEAVSTKVDVRSPTRASLIARNSNDMYGDLPQ
ncbi:uridine-cytidine kinase B [Fimicolochytrium jonesii]|uniref:uridine-cytidine kinase B n=1 Tax=Fimicolochytrium jonesii TaxID=1396493 RepID=UPI0022FEAFD8|nr:uridine-cytidine kinase B [Fimicolochytrium jonesii]KAI8826653.1 uridine-cytidine kinase B [Fimicolochytrium jonesii]